MYVHDACIPIVSVDHKEIHINIHIHIHQHYIYIFTYLYIIYIYFIYIYTISYVVSRCFSWLQWILPAIAGWAPTKANMAMRPCFSSASRNQGRYFSLEKAVERLENHRKTLGKWWKTKG